MKKSADNSGWGKRRGVINYPSDNVRGKREMWVEGGGGSVEKRGKDSATRLTVKPTTTNQRRSTYKKWMAGD